MLPNTIVGSVVTSKGATPFVINTATGDVKTGTYAAADSGQRNMNSMEHGAVDKQVRAKVSGARDVKIGSYQCPTCQRWVDVVKKPNDWRGDHCAQC